MESTGKKPPFMFLRLLSIPHWMAIHYALAAFIMFFAAPSSVVIEIQRASGGFMQAGIWGFLFAFCAIILAIDGYMPPQKFRLYLLAWMAYLTATVTIAFRTLITDQSIPGIYLAALGYSGEMIFMLISYSTLHSVWTVAEKLADMEPFYRRLLSKTDLKWFDRE
jgi:hypothetical protein